MNLKWKFHPKLQNKTGCSKGRYSATLPLPSEREKKHSILFYPSLFFLAHCSLWISSSLPCRSSLYPHSPYHSLFLSGLHQIVPPFSSIYLYIYTLSTLALATIVGSLNIQDYPCMFSFFHSGLQSKHHKENFGSRHAFCTYCHVLLIPIFSFLTLQLLLTLHLFFYIRIRYSLFVFFFIFLKLFNNMYIWENVCMYVLFNMSELK